MTLLEREPLLEALAAALREAAGGGGRVALVYGEAGIGKTTLVDAFAREHAGPGRVLRGACDSLLTPRPLGPVYDIAGDAGPALRESLEAGAAPAVLFPVLAELGRRPPVIAILEDLHWADEATLDLVIYALPPCVPADRNPVYLPTIMSRSMALPIAAYPARFGWILSPGPPTVELG